MISKTGLEMMYKGGHTLREIADYYGVSKSWIDKLVRRYGLWEPQGHAPIHHRPVATQPRWPNRRGRPPPHQAPRHDRHIWVEPP